MKDIKSLGDKVEELRSEIVALSDVADGDLTDEQRARWQPALDEFDAAKAEYEAARAREAKVAEVRSTVIERTAEVEPEKRQAPEVIIKRSAFDVLESRGRGMSNGEYRQALIDGNLRAMEGNIEENANQAHFERVLKRHASDTRWAENLLARMRPDYQSAFSKLMVGDALTLTNEERTAMSVGSNTNGGFLVPTHLDPTIILTNAGSANVVRQIARKVTLTEGRVWNGVTSAGVTASYDAELSEVSDDTPTFGHPSIYAEKAQAFVQASIEAFEDIAGLTSDVLMLFADARDVLEGAKFATGAGHSSNEPRGIFTALDANTNVEIVSTTAAAIGLVDLDALYAAVPQRFRRRSSWLTNPKWSLAIKDLGAAVGASFTTDLTQGTAGTLLGRPLYESDDAPSTATTTVRDNEIVLGDFNNYVVVDKPGSMSVEFIQHLFNTSNNLPDGRRGWYCYWRSGGDSVNDLAFRLLQDKTSA